jgi:hypothetical protein
MSDVFVFLGPSLPVSEARLELDAAYLPPVAEGDVYRAAQRRPRAIGIVDGYFERVPAVWHKEILWAMSQGIYVFGAASMGALRATELETFGMIGVGRIFEAFRNGELDQDDEVAVSHAGAENGFHSMSDAMVNVRITLQAAQDQGVISAEAHGTLVGIAKSLFYRDRSWPAIRRNATNRNVTPQELDVLYAWLPTGEVNQKALDTIAMLREIRAHLSADPPPVRPRWNMANTVAWNTSRRHTRELVTDDSEQLGVSRIDAVLDEIRLLGPESFDETRRRALLRMLATEFADEEGFCPSGKDLHDAVDRHRLRLGLESWPNLVAYVEDNDLSISQFEQLVQTEEKVLWTTEHAGQEALDGLFHDLRVDAMYRPLVSRAQGKEVVLRSQGLLASVPSDLGRSDYEVLCWYFTSVLGIEVPKDVAAHAKCAGFRDELAFRRAVWLEYCYVELTRSGAEGSDIEDVSHLRDDDIVTSFRCGVGVGERTASDRAEWVHPLTARFDPSTPPVQGSRTPSRWAQE